MNKFIQSIFSYKKLLCKGQKSGVYFHPISSVRGFRNIKLNSGASIRKGVTISVEKGLMDLKKNTLLNFNSNLNIRKGIFQLGENSFLNNDCTLIVIGKVIIGKNVMIAPKCSIICGSHNYKDIGIDYINQSDVEGEIIIGDNVWIGTNCCILSNVTIGDGSIIGAGSVLTKNVGRFELWAGNPAKVIKRYNFDTCRWEKVDKKGEFINE
jgi:acetyltransferase-like isoleucine patch superfamily enzyme